MIACPPTCPPNCVTLFANRVQTCVVSCKDGFPFSWTVPAGTLFRLSQQQADFEALSLACSRARVRKICFTTEALPNGKVGQSYDQTIRAMGGVPFQFPFSAQTFCATFDPVPYRMEIVGGALPDGLLLSCVDIGSTPNTGQITGVPTLAGTFTFTVKATDAVGAFQQRQYQITIASDDMGTITPPITSTIGADWGTKPAGTYKIAYVRGALRFADTPQWWLNGPFGAGYKIRRGGGADVDFPGTHGPFGSQAAVEASNVGVQISVTHSGGIIGMYLFDPDFSGNFPGSPSPTFRLFQ